MPHGSVSLSPNRSHAPHFDELNDKTFEEMCRALFDKEPHLCNVDFYGVRGQKQFGIDVNGIRTDGAGLEVVSCKCYAKHANWQIRRFSDDFLDHWDTKWKPLNVRRFVLASAAPVDETQTRDVIHAEFLRFEKIGVRYEVWGPNRLLELLRPHPAIVRQYLNPQLVEGICGRSETVDAPGAMANGLLSVQFNAQLIALDALQTRFAGQVATQVDRAFERIRRGDGPTVERELGGLRADPPTWTALGPGTQAKVLRLLASCRLGDGDVAGAERLADEADALDPPLEEPLLRALIALRRDGAAAALAVLGEPGSRDGAHLHAGLLVETGQLDAALAVLVEHPALATPDAETWRLRALIALERNDRDAAVAAIREAEALAPDWPAVLEAGGRIRYARAVSSAVPPMGLRSPNPLDLDLILEDVPAQRLLDEAERAFARWLEGPLDGEDRVEAETWRLAARAARRRRLDEAEAYAGDLLRRDPAHWGAIAWSLARGFRLDRTASLQALDDRLKTGQADAAHLAVAVWLHLTEGRPEEARRQLDCHSECFPQPNDRALLAVWRRRCEAHDDSAPDDTPHAALDRALTLARRTGEWQTVCDQLPRVAERDDSVALLLPACLSLAAAGRWPEIVPWIEALAARIGTAEAVRVAAFAAGNSGDARLALELIDRYLPASGSDSLPVDLRRLRAAALQKIGDTAGGLREAAGLVVTSGAPADLLLQAELAFRIGDLTPAALALRNPAIIDALPAAHAAQWAGRLASTAPDTSRTLLEHAVARGLPDEAIPFALSQGYRLAADGIIRRLLPELARLAAPGADAPVRTLSIDEMPDFLAALGRRTESLSEGYARGQIPVHLIAPGMAAGFAGLYSPDERSDAPGAARQPLFVRHGGRAATTASWSPADPLHVDVTALLLADGIGLLDTLDAAGLALHLPQSLPLAILELEFQAGDHQPDLAAARDAIRRAAAGRRVGVAGASGPAPEDGAPNWRVVHAVEEPDDATIDTTGRPVVPLRAVADALRASGWLAPERHADVVAALGPDAREAAATLPTPGDRLLFEDDTLEALTVAGALDETLRTFVVDVERPYLDGIDAEAAAREDRRRLAERLARLRGRIADRVRSGAWRSLPERAQPDDGTARRLAGGSEIGACLDELLTLPRAETATLWIDDRCISRYGQLDGHPVVGVADVLDALHASGRISAPERFAFLLRLRRMRAHFLPVSADEVLHHLDAAPLIVSAIVETPALRTLRQSHADTLLLEERWSVPGRAPADDGIGELPLALRAARLFDETLLAIWRRLDVACPVREAWSDWAWMALRTQRLAALPEIGEAATRSLAVRFLAAPFAFAIELFAFHDGPEQKRCRELMAWLDRRFLAPALESDPALVDEVAAEVAALLASTVELHPEAADAKESRIWQAFLGRFVDVLPEAIRDRLYRDSRFMEVVGIRFQSRLEIGGVAFEPEAFWAAVARVRSGRTARLETADDRAAVVLSPAKGKGPEKGIVIVGALDARLPDDPLFAVLAANAVVRRRVLERRPDWIDLPPEARTRLIASIAEDPSPAARVQSLEEARDRSVPHRRRQRVQTLRSHGRVNLTPSEAGDLMAHLRFAPLRASASSTLADAAGRLVDETGPAEALRRLGGLPVPPPAAIVDGFSALPPAERDRALEELATTPLGPVARLQVIALLRRFAHDRLTREIDRLLDDWRRIGDSFVAVLRWIAAQHGDAPVWQQLAGPYRLALIWTHAHQLVEDLMAVDVDRDAVLDAFPPSVTDRRLQKALERDPAFDDSLLNPDRMVDSASLLYHGLAAALGPDADAALSTDQKSRLTALLRGNGTPNTPRISLLHDARGLDDPFGSFLGQRPASLLEDVVGAGWTLAEAATVAARSAITERPDDPQGWLLAHVTGLDRAPSSMELSDPLARLDIARLAIKGGDRAGAAVLEIAAGMASRCDEATARSFREHLANAARRIAARQRGPVLPVPADTPPAKARAEAAHRLLEALAAASKRPTLADAVAGLADGLVRLAEAWPEAAPFWRHVAEDFLGRLPFEANAPLWHAVLQLRARP